MPLSDHRHRKLARGRQWRDDRRARRPKKFPFARMVVAMGFLLSTLAITLSSIDERRTRHADPGPRGTTSTSRSRGATRFCSSRAIATSKTGDYVLDRMLVVHGHGPFVAPVVGGLSPRGSPGAPWTIRCRTPCAKRRGSRLPGRRSARPSRWSTPSYGALAIPFRPRSLGSACTSGPIPASALTAAAQRVLLRRMRGCANLAPGRLPRIAFVRIPAF